MKFAHMADCHLGGWRQPELSLLNLQHFQKAISLCLKEKVEFVLIAGDLFDSAYPSIDTLKEAFREFRRLREADIPVFLIAGSHDYSVTGKTFLDVLEKAGFCKNVAHFEEKNGALLLYPTIHQNVALYGYPGKKSGMDVDEVEHIKIQDAPGLFKILMLHTTLKSVISNPLVKSVDDAKLPPVNYVALGHLHMSYCKNGKVYPGPIFPNSLPELEELQAGSFYIFDNGKIEKQKIQVKEVLVLEYETTDAFNATEDLLKKLEKESVRDKIIILKISGIIEQGRSSDINFAQIEAYLKKRGAWVFLKNTSRLQLSEQELHLDTINTDDIESQIIKKFETSSQSKFNKMIVPLMKVLQTEKLEDEKNAIFEERLLSETKKIIAL